MHLCIVGKGDTPLYEAQLTAHTGKVQQDLIQFIIHAVGGASARMTFICVFCTLRAQISRSICNFTHYSVINNNYNNLTINMQLHALQCH
jgi:hypothetical protein